MSSATEPEADDGALAELRAAAEALSSAEEAVAAVGEADAERVAAAYEEATALLAKYRESATGTGDFRAFVEFQENVEEFVEGLDEDLPRRDAFEEYESVLDQRRLNEGDFERARAALEPAEEVAGRLEEREAARHRYRRARGAVADRLDEVEARIADLERLRELGEADLDAPVERLREPVEAYDEAVRSAFRSFRREAPAREVLGVAAEAADRPLVGFRSPPGELLAYVREAEVGTEPVPRLLEYADYSRSKLSHYVADADELKRRVATHLTYLERLDAGPLTVEWPPPPAEELRWRAIEYERVVRRFAGEDVVARARSVRLLARRDDYAELRSAAVARDELSEAQLRRLREGAVERELEERRRERERLETALAEHPER